MRCGKRRLNGFNKEKILLGGENREMLMSILSSNYRFQDGDARPEKDGMFWCKNRYVP